jgi:mannonate dehydratase
MMEQAWRWFGPDEPTTLRDVTQTGATGIVTALHHVKYGEVWTVDEIMARKNMIEADPELGLRWSVVESLQIPEAVKLGEGDLEPMFEKYRQSIRNLAQCGIETICYNFMTVQDWMRTEHSYLLPGGARALRFNAYEYAAFDCFILKRKGAEADQTPEVLDAAKRWMDKASEADQDRLFANIMAGLPGAFERYDLQTLRDILARHAHITKDMLRDNLKTFLQNIIPTAEDCGVRMCIHPDDPPRPLLGLPRITCNEEDIAFILGCVPSLSNGLTFCTGSLGANVANDVPHIAERFADKIHFAHLRNVSNDPDGSFMEAAHLDGDVDMVAVVEVLLREQKRRQEAGRKDWRIPFRPDHGHELLDDVTKPTHPGYPAIGRLRGLAEIRGVMTAVAKMYNLPT